VSVMQRAFIMPIFSEEGGDEMQTCYSCRNLCNEPFEPDVWCSETGKLICDGFGEGDCTPCSRFKPVPVMARVAEDLEPLPF
jgi:hypothetical protein